MLRILSYFYFIRGQVKTNATGLNRDEHWRIVGDIGDLLLNSTAKGGRDITIIAKSIYHRYSPYLSYLSASHWGIQSIRFPEGSVIIMFLRILSKALRRRYRRCGRLSKVALELSPDLEPSSYLSLGVDGEHGPLPTLLIVLQIAKSSTIGDDVLSLDGQSAELMLQMVVLYWHDRIFAKSIPHHILVAFIGLHRIFVSQCIEGRVPKSRMGAHVDCTLESDSYC